MRILHTSDWHLGASTGPASRLDEQRRFLEWLGETLTDREVDVLLVAGDIFDSMHPSAEAQSTYFRFLAGVSATGVRDVVVVGGNHDSAAGLDAPESILAALDVHTVGGVPASGNRSGRMVVPLRSRGSDEVCAVCLAVPYVHEYRLGIRTSDLDRAQTRSAFREAFAGLYRELADYASERFPGAPIVATGHLTLGPGSRKEDAPQEIHQVGYIEGIPAEILDPRIRYAALGHIHRSYPVVDGRAWYCGTPIPYSLTEMAAARRVLAVDICGDGPPVVEPIAVPRARDLVQVTGSPDAVLAELAALIWETPLPPLVHVCVETPMVEPGLNRRIGDAVAHHPVEARPVLVEVQQRSLAETREDMVPKLPALDELSPDQVFGLLCDARQLAGEERVQLERAFVELASLDPETLEAFLAAIDRGDANEGGAT